MRKLLVALALVPAIGHAALVIEDGPAHDATRTLPKDGATVKAKAALENNAAVAAIAAVAAQTVAPTDSPNSKVTVAPVLEASPADQTFQKLFARWGKETGWQTFWEVDQDIPVAAKAPFSGSFTDAVQDVLDTTLSTDLPAHPCFYTNNVLRVLPTSTECDPK